MWTVTSTRDGTVLLSSVHFDRTQFNRKGRHLDDGETEGDDGADVNVLEQPVTERFVASLNMGKEKTVCLPGPPIPTMSQHN